MQPDQPQPSVPEAHSTATQFGNSLPKTSPLPEQNKLPNPIPSNSASDENEDELIPCPYDSRIVLMIVASVMRGFGAPMFPLWTTISSNCTIPSVC